MTDVSEEIPLEDSGEETVVVTEEDGETDVDNSEVNVEVEPVVIVETPPAEDGASDAEIDRAVETERRFSDIETQLGALTGMVADLSGKVEMAQVTADIAEGEAAAVAETVEPMEDALAESVAEELGEDIDNDPDTEPNTSKRHVWFQSWKELRGRE